VVRAAVVLVGVAYVVSLVPGVRSEPGFDTGLDVWLNDTFCLGVVSLTLIRAFRDRSERWAFVAMAVGLACDLIGSMLYQLAYLPNGEIPYPSWADAAWLAFYPATYVTVVLLLRRRVRRLPLSVWLDGAVAGLTAAALGTALAFRSLLASTEGSIAVVATNVAYPVADLLLLALILGAVTVVGVRGAGAAWWWLAIGIVIFTLADTVYAVQAAEGTYVDAGPLDAGWALAWLAFAGAAGARPATGVSTRLEGIGILALPGLCATASLVLLYAGYATGDADALAGVLALAALIAALVRTVLTFREVRALVDSRRQALTDDLTGLPNRRRAYQVLEAADEVIAGGRPFAVLLLDLDRFKEINDSLGHAVGDMLLGDLAPRLRERLRPGHVLARLGGDEFVVLAADSDVAAAQQIAADLRAELRHPFRMGPTSLTVDASIGIAVGPHHAATARDLLQRADMAMYAAKSRRTGVTVYDEERDGRTRTSWETVEQLRSGLPRGSWSCGTSPSWRCTGGVSPRSRPWPGGGTHPGVCSSRTPSCRSPSPTASCRSSRRPCSIWRWSSAAPGSWRGSTSRWRSTSARPTSSTRASRTRWRACWTGTRCRRPRSSSRSPRTCSWRTGSAPPPSSPSCGGPGWGSPSTTTGPGTPASPTWRGCRSPSSSSTAASSPPSPTTTGAGPS
jgi:diguanylate cyclase (GGDEF)-like protein